MMFLYFFMMRIFVSIWRENGIAIFPRKEKMNFLMK